MIELALGNFEERRKEALELDRRFQDRRIRYWVIRHHYLIWEQIETQVFQLKTYREVTIGEKEGDFTPWRIYDTREEFLDALKTEFGRKREPKGIFIGLNRMRDGEVMLMDFVLDLDWKDQPDREEALKGLTFLDEFLRSRGIFIRWALSGGGIHGYLGIDALAPRFREVLKEPSEDYSNLVELLEDYLRLKGFNLKFDHQIYKERGTIRAIYSPHRSGIVLYPMDPLSTEGLKEAKARAMAPWLHRPASPSWGYIQNIEEFIRIIEIARLNLELPVNEPSRSRRIVRLKGEKRAIVIDGKTITYPSELEGYGWIQFLVKSDVYPDDGRETLTWKVLGPAVGNGIIELKEAEDYLRRCIQEKPDPENKPEHYIRKLRYNAKGRANPPTWRTLLTLEGKNGPVKDPEGLRHLRDNLLKALADSGIVEVEDHANA